MFLINPLISQNSLQNNHRLKEHVHTLTELYFKKFENVLMDTVNNLNH